MKLLKSVKFRIILFTVAAMCLVGGAFLRKTLFSPAVSLPSETAASVALIVAAGENAWSIPKEAVHAGVDNKSYVMRLERLRAKKIEVFPTGPTGERTVVKSDALAPDDFVLINPAAFQDGAAVAVAAGMDEARLIELTLGSGIAAAEREDLAESARFFSPGYGDLQGFDFKLMMAMLARAYKEFDLPRIEMLDRPEIRIEGNHAFVRVSIRASAGYHGRRNYLLGGPAGANQLWVRMEKLPHGWKLAEVKGLMPLGFEEKFMKLLGAEVGVPLSEREKAEKKQFCMPCRRTMTERFGGEKR
jgi:hypothetical protein